MPPEQQASLTIDAVSDHELLALVRDGDLAAYDELFLRHRDVAFRLARRLTDAERADDLVAESFARILDLLRRGKGPDIAFRAYLLTTVRSLYLNQVRRGRETATDDADLEGLTTPVTEDPDARFDATAIARAFRELPERWQSALWLTAVEGRPTEEVSRHLGIRSSAVASLAFRARAGLRQAYLAEHLRLSADAECTRTGEQLPAYLRGTLAPRRRAVVEAHLDRCSRCSVAAAELADVDRRLGALLAPALLGSAAVALWPATAGVPAVPVVAGVLAGHGAAAPGFLGFVSRGTDIVRSAGVGAVAAAVVVAGAASVPGPSPSGPSSSRTADSLTSLGGGAVVAAPARAAVTPSPVAARVTSTPAATPTAVPAPATAPVLAKPVAPATPRPKAPPTPPPTPPPAPPPGPAITALTATAVDHGNGTWYEVGVTVSGAVTGSTLRLTSAHTTGVHVTGTDTRGWTCDNPATTDGVTVLTCTYDGHVGPEPDAGNSLTLDYEIDAPTSVTATLGSSQRTITLP
ncbi:MAG: sigma-70 family RNA polymerase sigma factor [Nocardioidaceae bacterium]|nr:sigma-70 family RNA polymerase sigma factor [Nocardioidaceae bacterium]